MFTAELENKIQTEFEKLKSIIPERYEVINNECSKYTRDEQVLLKFLYATMPVSDAVSYPFQVILDYAKHGVFLKENGIFKESIPEDIFLQYVVYHRINTEDISACRTFLYEKLKDTLDKVKNSSMEEAVKEINYWCASKATYRSSDDRTASPMTVYDSGYGRCGEESTFTVSVLRSAGIPARQVYAPRWSHCDDNHAWVEAWCDGTWKFLGACEPEEILNRGWFTSASSRAMILHSRNYGDVTDLSDENIVEGSKFVKELNQSKRYAVDCEITFKAADEDGNILAGADIKIGILNYSHFCTIAQLKTDKDGICKVNLGVGSLYVKAVFHNKKAEKLVTVEGDSIVELVLTNEKSEEEWNNFIFYAPKDSDKNVTVLTKDEKDTNRRRVKEVTELRLSRKHNVNGKEFEIFEAYEEDDKLKEALLNTLSGKDMLDVKAEVLISHMDASKKYREAYPKEIFEKYVLSPRIENERLTSYKEEIIEFFSEEEIKRFTENPKTIWKYIEEEISSTKREYDDIVTTPVACLENKVGNKLSKDILFVAVCRSLGIPARLNYTDGTKEYFCDGFKKVDCRDEKQGILELSFKSDEMLKYEEEFALVKKNGIGDKLIRLNGLSNPMKVNITEGEYELIVQNRLPNGNIYGRMISFEIKDGETKSYSLEKYEADVNEMLEKILLPEFTLTDMDDNVHSSKELLNGKKHLLLWLGEAQEPTEHILNEMAEKPEEFKNVGADICFITESRESYNDRNISRILSMIPMISKYTSMIEADCNYLGRRMYIDPERLPMIIVTDKESNGVYATSGYNVGTAEMLLRVLKEI